jgi:hypothetical protein
MLRLSIDKEAKAKAKIGTKSLKMVMMDTNLIRVAMQRRKERDLVTIEEEHKHF